MPDIYDLLLDGPPAAPVSDVACAICGARDILVTSERDGGIRCVRCCCQEINERAWIDTLLVQQDLLPRRLLPHSS